MPQILNSEISAHAQRLPDTSFTATRAQQFDPFLSAWTKTGTFAGAAFHTQQQSFAGGKVNESQASDDTSRAGEAAVAQRREHDAFGAIDVPAERLWGAQTQRALQHFQIGDEKMPAALILALAEVKRAAARVNGRLGELPPEKADAIQRAADEVIAGEHFGEFPLPVWQTGSGTQTNMNLNEVLANRASELLGGGRGAACRVHPNDDVNHGQSSNDVFPSAMHIAALLGIKHTLLPVLGQLRDALAAKSAEFADIVKTGRTHLQDATPLTLGQEFSGYVAQLAHAEDAIRATLPALHELAIGGTAVGTGQNAPAHFGEAVAAELSVRLSEPWVSAANKFAALAGHEALVAAHGGLKTLATALTKIANDLRWLASGPRCGLGELRLPENEPGSSIMPGKVNPTQCEALTMICYQVIGNDVALTLGAAAGAFELNVYKPLIIRNFLQSLRLLSDGMSSMERWCVRDITAQRTHIAELAGASLMLVTALVPHIGYDRAADIAKRAHRDGLSLKAAALAIGGISADDLERWLDPRHMLGTAGDKDSGNDAAH
ncbi:class II fumarate hydratase [Rhodocyclus gracilis]|uniref:Fumarate hydratase class II n=1 Tax=Rhodocyclus tenuis TaxID=1066 RepID=A0A6L5JUQ5_RHOTE|nr:class II fumarate hydratase [Rhodocyclus gracilis]MQY50939.1 class II fumarate hydratase [Rhodocyclus gracilis]